MSLTVDAARALAIRLGITLDTSQTIPGMPPNTIASQSAQQGTKIDRNSVVHVVVNNGMPNGPVESPAANGPVSKLPSVVGDDYATARQALTQSGFQIAVRFAQQSTNNGYIVAQTPSAGPQASGSTVTITLSVSGEVPDTVGLSQFDAMKLLQQYGYSVSHSEYTESVGEGGKVVGTEPPAGTSLAPGSSVTLTVNGTPPP